MNTGRNWTKRLTMHPQLTGLLTKILPPWVTVFMLHRIEDQSRDIEGINQDYLRRCLQYLQRNDFEFISIEDAISFSLNGELEHKKWIAFSLDDGYEEQVRLGNQIFQEFDCPVTCFLITGFVDGTLWPWDHQLMFIARQSKRQTIRLQIDGVDHSLELGTPLTEKLLLGFVRKFAPSSAYEITARIAHAAGVDIPEAPPDNMRSANWDEIRRAEQTGMQFAAHSVSHRILSGLSNEELEQEITDSYKRVFEECSNPSPIFCYPSGKVHEFDERAFGTIQKLGAIGGISAEPGNLSSRRIRQSLNYRYAIPRMTIQERFSEFQQYVSWLQHVRENFSQSALKKYY